VTTALGLIKELEEIEQDRIKNGRRK